MKYITLRTELANFNRKHFFTPKDKNEYVKKMLERVWEEAIEWGFHELLERDKLEAQKELTEKS